MRPIQACSAFKSEGTCQFCIHVTCSDSSEEWCGYFGNTALHCINKRQQIIISFPAILSTLTQLCNTRTRVLIKQCLQILCCCHCDANRQALLKAQLAYSCGIFHDTETADQLNVHAKYRGCCNGHQSILHVILMLRAEMITA